MFAVLMVFRCTHLKVRKKKRTFHTFTEKIDRKMLHKLYEILCEDNNMLIHSKDNIYFQLFELWLLFMHFQSTYKRGNNIFCKMELNK